MSMTLLRNDQSRDSWLLLGNDGLQTMPVALS